MRSCPDRGQSLHRCMGTVPVQVLPCHSRSPPLLLRPTVQGLTFTPKTGKTRAPPAWETMEEFPKTDQAVPSRKT